MGGEPPLLHHEGDVAVLLAVDQRPHVLGQDVDVVDLPDGGVRAQGVAVTHPDGSGGTERRVSTGTQKSSPLPQQVTLLL